MPSQEEIQAQLDAMHIPHKWWGRREIKELPNILWEDEKVERVVQGTYGGGQGLLVGTNKRLVFIDKGMLGGVKVEDFPYDKITSIQYSTGLVFGKITIFTSGNKSEIDQVEKKVVRDFGEGVRARVSGIAPSATTAAPPSIDALSVVEQLERLGSLKDRGILSEEEFAAQKAKILGT